MVPAIDVDAFGDCANCPCGRTSALQRAQRDTDPDADGIYG
jgi:hypothetical protein